MVKREHQPRRRPSVRPERKRILIFCGGVRTEPAYLDGIRIYFRDKPVALEVKSKSESPERLVRHVAELASQDKGFYDEVWCVVDVDEFDVAAAMALAKEAGINLAISNPCFELWLLLHHLKQTSELEHCGKATERLAKVLPRYDKTRLRFADFAWGIADAVERGKQLEPTGEDHKQNPSTGMWRLVERIIK